MDFNEILNEKFVSNKTEVILETFQNKIDTYYAKETKKILWEKERGSDKLEIYHTEYSDEMLRLLCKKFKLDGYNVEQLQDKSLVIHFPTTEKKPEKKPEYSNHKFGFCNCKCYKISYYTRQYTEDDMRDLFRINQDCYWQAIFNLWVCNRCKRNFRGDIPMCRCEECG